VTPSLHPSAEPEHKDGLVRTLEHWIAGTTTSGTSPRWPHVEHIPDGSIHFATSN
jgi:hypothetical protein